MAWALVLGMAAIGSWTAGSASAEQATYSTGRQGSKLKWLAPTAAQRKVDRKVRRVQHLWPRESAAPTDMAPLEPLSPLDDAASEPAGRMLEPMPIDDADKPSIDFNDELMPRSDSLDTSDAAGLPPLGDPSAEPDDLPEIGHAPAEPSPWLDERRDDGTPAESSQLRTMEEEEQELLRRDLRLGKCISPKALKRISQLTTDITAPSGNMPQECPLAAETFEPRCWAPTQFTWKATALCHKPLYFEDTQLERYGHSWGPYLQPLMSGGHFFLSVPILPYQMALRPPDECTYTLGYYRPGNCAPYLIDPLPLSVRAALAEGGIWTAMVFLIP